MIGMENILVPMLERHSCYTNHVDGMLEFRWLVMVWGQGIVDLSTDILISNKGHMVEMYLTLPLDLQVAMTISFLQ